MKIPSDTTLYRKHVTFTILLVFGKAVNSNNLINWYRKRNGLKDESFKQRFVLCTKSPDVEKGMVIYMKKFYCSYKTICYYYNKIHLVDKCLLFFMLVLLLQSTFSLFLLPCSSGEAHTIDIIVRTSISGIFGYFLSANFIRQESTSQKENTKTKTPTTLNHTEDTAIKNKIGFTPPEPETELKPGNISFTPANETESKKDATGKLQIIVATFIGLFCLIMLILVRNLCALHILDLSDSSFTATVSQFRDLVSGCVGFLIGCPSIIKNKS